mmetsp:Transcript_24514/g.76263  ORF Transcript_24514/g.76263 Transcript_24514/m.76263 type:complete len:226 (-) Transcript_24514:155-832(-)
MELSVTERPQIIYALVVRGQNSVLAEYTALAGNFQQATMLIMRKLEFTEDCRSYLYGEYAFHYIVHEATGLWFVCMAERTMGRRLPFAFLGELQELFEGRFTAEEVQSAIAYGMQGACRDDMKALIEKYNSPGADRVTALMEKVQHINDNVMESIDKILERQERIELLVSRSSDLAQSSGSFRREAQGLRRRGWLRDVRCLAALVLVLILAMAIIVAAHSRSPAR